MLMPRGCAASSSSNIASTSEPACHAAAAKRQFDAFWWLAGAPTTARSASGEALFYGFADYLRFQHPILQKADRNLNS
jgi:hypothetical protein